MLETHSKTAVRQLQQQQTLHNSSNLSANGAYSFCYAPTPTPLLRLPSSQLKFRTNLDKICFLLYCEAEARMLGRCCFLSLCQRLSPEL